jgi:hypothetical protein
MTLSTCSLGALAFSLGLGLFGISGCRNWSSSGVGAPPEPRETSADAASPVGAKERRIPRKLAGDAAEPLSCRTDADCVITCHADGSCCLEQCGCSYPMSRVFLARLESHLSAECGPDPLCPVAGCVGTKLYEARCDNGQCTARKLPGGV